MNNGPKQKLFHSLVEKYDNIDQRLYITCLRSVRYKPDYLMISSDHKISLSVQWVLTYWEISKDHNKVLKLQKIADSNKELIIF